MQHQEFEWYFGPVREHSLELSAIQVDPDLKIAKRALDDAFRNFVITLESKSKGFDFVGATVAGPALLVGEGNLSFARALAGKAGRSATQILATTFERETELSSETRRNSAELRRMGLQVLHGVDATALDRPIWHRRFNLIAFQFPNIASRSPVYGRNPNHILMRRFLKSAAHCLAPRGNVAVTLVNTPFYLGAFNIPEAARVAHYRQPEVFPFRPGDFPGYAHVNTVAAGSALLRHRSFSTWVLSPQASGA